MQINLYILPIAFAVARQWGEVFSGEKQNFFNEILDLYPTSLINFAEKKELMGENLKLKLNEND